MILNGLFEESLTSNDNWSCATVCGQLIEPGQLFLLFMGPYDSLRVLSRMQHHVANM